MTKENKQTRSSGWIGKALILAAIVSLLAVTASAAEAGWFHSLFASVSGQPLTQSQTELISQKEQPVQDVQTQEDWTVSLQSTMNDGTVGYIVLRVTAPENVSLEEKDARLDFGNPRILESPEGVNCSFSGYWMEDGDGKENTKNHILEVYPSFEATSAAPFGEASEWKLHIDQLVWEKDGEKEVLTDGVWDFSFSFAEEEESVELLREPVFLQADVTLWEEENSREVRETVKVTSIQLSALSAKVYYEASGIPEFWSDGGMVQAVMKDGSTVNFMPGALNWYDTGYYLMDVVAPIVLEEVSCIRFGDGTEVPMPE